MQTNESSGPVKVWNHHLVFRPAGKSSCRYTDEIEIPAGASGFGTKIFIECFFRYRQWRWRRMLS